MSRSAAYLKLNIDIYFSLTIWTSRSMEPLSSSFVPISNNTAADCEKYGYVTQLNIQIFYEDLTSSISPFSVFSSSTGGTLIILSIVAISPSRSFGFPSRARSALRVGAPFINSVTARAVARRGTARMMRGNI